MPRKKLTLSVDEAAIQRARRYSKRHGTSVSELVSRFLASLDDEADTTTVYLISARPFEVSLR